MSHEALLLTGVNKLFGTIHALDGVDFEVKRGEVFGFLGPNGAGKTTTIRILTGFIRPTSGSATVLEMDAWRESVSVKRRLGFLPDVIAFAGGFTGQAFLDHMSRLRGIKGKPRLQADIVDRLELSRSVLGRKIKGYSSGMAKKLALVQALQHDPELLIMDEPTETLDPLMRQVLFDLFRELRGRGVTIFLSSHVLADVEEICERVALIRGGRIVRAGSVDDLRKGHPRTMRVTFRESPAEPLSIPGANVMARDGTAVRLAVTGDLNAVVRELARYDLNDLEYERLSLEELFLGYYQRSEAERQSEQDEEGRVNRP